LGIGGNLVSVFVFQSKIIVWLLPVMKILPSGRTAEYGKRLDLSVSTINCMGIWVPLYPAKNLHNVVMLEVEKYTLTMDVLWWIEFISRVVDSCIVDPVIELLPSTY
jgi:hypothetical protein